MPLDTATVVAVRTWLAVCDVGGKWVEVREVCSASQGRYPGLLGLELWDPEFSKPFWNSEFS